MSLNVLTQGGGAGGETASIFVTGLDENSTVSASKDGKMVQGKWAPKPIHRDGFTVLEYIKSTGAQYIDALLQTTGSLRFWIDFSIENEISANDIGTVFGMRSSGIWENAYDYAMNTYPNFSGGTFQVGRVSVPTENVSADPKIVPNKRCQISYLGNTFTAADGTTTELAPQSFNASYTLFLFAKHIVNDVGEFGRVTLYRANFYDGSTLIRDFVPMRRNADGVVGLYDVVNDVFYTDGRNGAFIAGSESPQYTYGHEIAKIKEYGMYTVTATDGEKTKTQDVLVDAAVDYEIFMDLYKLWLYREGDECEDVTGGWTKTATLNSGKLTKGTDNITFSGVGDNHESFIAFTNIIDVTEYSKIRVTVSDLKIYRGRPTGGIWLDNLSSSPIGGWARPTAYTNNTLPSSDFTEVDISNVSGEHQIWIGISGGGAYADSTTEFSLYEMWLE